MHRKTLLALGLLGLWGGAHAQVNLIENGFDKWDFSNDGLISPQEFEQGVDAGWLVTWDRDADRRIGPGEFRGLNGARFEDWDGDRSGALDETEFRGSLFETWDTNDDGYVDGSEWVAAGDLGWFGL